MSSHRQSHSTVFISAAVLRLCIFLFTDTTWAIDRVELSTPVTSFKRLKEGLYLYESNISVYDNNVFHQPPLLLPFFQLLYSPFSATINSRVRELFVQIVYIICDLLIGWCLIQIGKEKGIIDGTIEVRDSVRKETLEDESDYDDNSEKESNPESDDDSKPLMQKEKKRRDRQQKLSKGVGVTAFKGEWDIQVNERIVLFLYLFNPLTILSCISQNTNIFTSLATVFGIYAATRGRLIQSSMSIAAASYLGVYPIMYISPVILILARTLSKKNTDKVQSLFGVGMKVTICTLLWISAFLFLSFLMVDESVDEFIKCLKSVYGTILLVSDLRPNIGLWWYLFIEIFEHFRKFFLFVFQFHLFSYVVPFSIRFKSHPLFIVYLLSGVIATFKSYPSVGDIVLAWGFLSLFPEIFKYMRYSFLSSSIFIYTCFLSPLFYHLWLYTGSGNANFFYAITLVIGLGNVLVLTDSVFAFRRRLFDIQHAGKGGNEEETEVVQVY